MFCGREKKDGSSSCVRIAHGLKYLLLIGFEESRTSVWLVIDVVATRTENVREDYGSGTGVNLVGAHVIKFLDKSLALCECILEYIREVNLDATLVLYFGKHNVQVCRCGRVGRTGMEQENARGCPEFLVLCDGGKCK